MKIMITGANGTIGADLVNFFLQKTQNLCILQNTKLCNEKF